MNKLEVIIERTDDGLWASIPALPGCVSFGSNFTELKHNLKEAIELHVEGMHEDGDIVPIFKEFLFRIDMTYFFNNYPVSITGIAKLSGINRSLLNQYAAGIKSPSIKQAKIIQDSIRCIGEEMSVITFI
ncbi:MAG: type II toxin-antitoxin system HicB family antitoxin [Bacteroidales bacterium]|nr:type II toxin-antitoxin system HicB family antitoxin [Bacteroidales bacterium]